MSMRLTPGTGIYLSCPAVGNRPLPPLELRPRILFMLEVLIPCWIDGNSLLPEQR